MFKVLMYSCRSINLNLQNGLVFIAILYTQQNFQFDKNENWAN